MRPVIGIHDRYSQVAGTSTRSRTTQGRIIDAIEYLQAEGLATVCLVTNESLINNQPPHFDALITSRPKSSEDFAALTSAKSQRQPIIIDIDDNLNHFPAWSDVSFSRSQVDMLLDLADIITVPNEILFRQFIEHHQFVRIVESGFYVEKYVNKKLPINRSGFHFTMCNADNLKSDDFARDFCETILQFVSEKPDIYFHYFGDKRFPSGQERIIDYLNLSFLEHKKILSEHKFDLAVMMLGNRSSTNEAFYKSKSPVKFWEHAAFTIPGLFSADTIYDQFVEDGETGFLVRNDPEIWLSKLRFAYDNVANLRQVGRWARSKVIERHHIRKTAHGFLNAVNEALND